jgi:benzoyl-CoA 2,3-epoxidase subunit B
MIIENVDYTTKIPNNVNLTDDRQVLRALESWHPGYIDWWMDMGPEGFSRRSSICAPPCRSIRRAGRSSTM